MGGGTLFRDDVPFRPLDRFNCSAYGTDANRSWRTRYGPAAADFAEALAWARANAPAVWIDEPDGERTELTQGVSAHPRSDALTVWESLPQRSWSARGRIAVQPDDLRTVELAMSANTPEWPFDSGGIELSGGAIAFRGSLKAPTMNLAAEIIVHAACRVAAGSDGVSDATQRGLEVLALTVASQSGLLSSDD